jgi:hypothetical protein
VSCGGRGGRREEAGGRWRAGGCALGDLGDVQCARRGRLPLKVDWESEPRRTWQSRDGGEFRVTFKLLTFFVSRAPTILAVVTGCHSQSLAQQTNLNFYPSMQVWRWKLERASSRQLRAPPTLLHLLLPKTTKTTSELEAVAQDLRISVHPNFVNCISVLFTDSPVTCRSHSHMSLVTLSSAPNFASSSTSS